MNLDGTYSSIPLTRIEHMPNVPWPDLVCSWMFSSLSLFLDVDLVEESMWITGGLQSLARTQSFQYVINDSDWVYHVAFWISLAWALLDSDFDIWFCWLFKHIEWKLLTIPEELWGKNQEPRTWKSLVQSSLFLKWRRKY